MELLQRLSMHQKQGSRAYEQATLSNVIILLLQYAAKA